MDERTDRQHADSHDDRAAREIVRSLTPVERDTLVELWSEELRRGWIPRRADLEAGVQLIRATRDPDRP